MLSSTSVCTPWSRNSRGEELGENLWRRGVCQTPRTRPQHPCYTVTSTMLPRSLDAGYTIFSASVGSESRRNAPEMK